MDRREIPAYLFLICGVLLIVGFASGAIQRPDPAAREQQWCLEAHRIHLLSGEKATPIEPIQAKCRYVGDNPAGAMPQWILDADEHRMSIIVNPDSRWVVVMVDDK